MAKHLCIDCGNTRVKAAIVDRGVVTRRATATLEQCEAVLDMARESRPAAAMLVSTTDGDATLAAALAAVLPCPLQRLDASRQLPLRLAYRTPATLGPDRLAAAAGAWQAFTGCNLLVADAGTALTLDVVLADGTLLGGSISPGVDMRLRALAEHTSRLPRVTADGDVPLVGYDTHTALRSGAVLGTAAEVDAAALRLQAALGRVKVVLTGGDAPLLLPHLITGGATHEPDLVTLGADALLTYADGQP